MRVVSIHGFKIRDAGKGTTDRLAPFVKGQGWEIDVDEGDYGYWSLIKIIFWRGAARRHVLERLVEAIKKADVVYAHSNGVNFAYQALRLLSPEFDGTKIMICISGAVNANTPIPTAVKAQLVLHTPHDFWVRLSSYIPFNPWGRQGAIGFRGDDPRNTNRKDCSITGHSKWFSRGNLVKTWKHMLYYIRRVI